MKAKQMKKILVLALAAAGAAMGANAVVAVETRGELTVRPNSCPKCPFRMRIAPDAKTAFVNTAKVSEADYPKMAERAFSLMEKAADSKKGGVRRPLMGWSSWNTFVLEISEDRIVSVAEAMATNGLAEAGYRYVNIDDGFFCGHDEAGRLKINPVRFPNGLKPVVDRIHALGLKAGIYSDAGRDTCGSFGDDKSGAGSGFYGHDLEDSRFYFGECGFDFVKIDWCGGQDLKLDAQERYTAIRRAIDASGKKGVRMNICCWRFPGVWARGVAESWRTTADIQGNWGSVKKIIDENIPLAGFMSLGHYNDMDMLEVGHLVGRPETLSTHRGDTGLTRLEEQTHFGMWCFMSSPLLLGCDVRKMDETTHALVTNPFLVGMNQNDLAARVDVVLRRVDAYVMVKDCDVAGGTSRYLALYNGSDGEYNFDVPLVTLDLGGKVAFFDLVERADLGEFERTFSVAVPAHGARFFRLDAERRR